MTLSESHHATINRFLQDHDLPDLYRSYTWKGDTWEKGFPDLFRLEEMISQAAMDNALDRTHLIEIATWGSLPNPKNVSCQDPIRISLYHDGAPAFWLENEPENAVCILGCRIRGFGPTYCSKVLHFAVPQIFGAIDTRLVRVFGKGDPLSGGKYQLLDLNVSYSNNLWQIPRDQEGWPREYGTWVRVLNHIAGALNTEGIACPHPEQYLQSGRREEGKWLPADVETALFSYASQVVKGDHDIQIVPIDGS
ncbi:hypothetical protein AZH53_09865 [Methanomicrobiaceae archaeon CYW5]|uniref:hypothetical protein n=1 Tax=Methanovulcanius yangii TaxID=1789227 RepID=UPI0029CA63E0|nr:hypothetical protein [Methanovulcanius yangii]MBT8508710.1 hypothetical protein [Methanovulcanius yangii]